MPVSDYHNIPAILDAILDCKSDGRSGRAALRILDVGCGFAKYGVLLREALEIGWERYEREHWTSIVDALEVWQRWITPIHLHVYNTIHIGELSATVFAEQPGLHNICGYDVVFLGDIIEHIERPKADKVLERLRSNNRFLVLSIPDSDHPAVAASPTAGGFVSFMDNPYEVHKSRWYRRDFPGGTFYETSGSACFVVRIPK